MNSLLRKPLQTSFIFALLAPLGLGIGAAQAQQPRTLSDCRAIEGELARYACYEALEEDAGAAAAAPAVPATPAAPAAPPRPVSNLPVVRRPSLSVGDLSGQTQAAEPAGAQAGTARSGAEVRTQEEKPGLLRRLLPFGGSDDEDGTENVDAETASVADTAAPAAGSEVDNFGRNSGGARVETNDEGRQELVDTVASVRTLNANLIEVTLSSGQVWRQMLTKRYPLREGDKVTIKPTVWGKSYRMTSERISGFIQVQRVD